MSSYQSLFVEPDSDISFDSMLDVISSLVTDLENSRLLAIPTSDEVKLAVYYMSVSNAQDPDGFTGAFYHACWNFIVQDIFDVFGFFNLNVCPLV